MTWIPLVLCSPVFVLAVLGVIKQVRIRLEAAHWEAQQHTREWEDRWFKHWEGDE